MGAVWGEEGRWVGQRVGEVVRGKRLAKGKGQRAKVRQRTGGLRRWERSGLVLAGNQRTRVLE